MHLLQVLLAWNTNTVLVSFRGTASLANALADIQVGFAASSLLPYPHVHCSCAKHCVNIDDYYSLPHTTQTKIEALIWSHRNISALLLLCPCD